MGCGVSFTDEQEFIDFYFQTIVLKNRDLTEATDFICKTIKSQSDFMEAAKIINNVYFDNYEVGYAGRKIDLICTYINQFPDKKEESFFYVCVLIPFFASKNESKISIETSFKMILEAFNKTDVLDNKNIINNDFLKNFARTYTSLLTLGVVETFKGSYKGLDWNKFAEYFKVEKIEIFVQNQNMLNNSQFTFDGLKDWVNTNNYMTLSNSVIELTKA